MNNKKQRKEIEKKQVDLDTKDIKEPKFKVHKMPKDYKTGRFENVFSGRKEEDNSSIYGEKSKQEKKSKSRKVGFLIISLGVIIIIALIYFVFVYINNPDKKIFDVSSLFNRETEVTEEENEEPFIEEEPIVEEEPIIEEEPIVEEEPIIEEEPIVEEEPEPVAEEAFIDSDSDGLNDLEEELLGTDSLNVDTDGDGFDDFTEVSNLYNPSGEGVISNNENIEEFINNPFSYTALYPINWELNALTDGSSVMFLAGQDSYIQIVVEENELEKDIIDWYFSRFFEVVDDSLVVEINGQEGVFSSDYKSFHLTDEEKNNVYSLVYNPSSMGARYQNIFRMMVNSFQLK